MMYAADVVPGDRVINPSTGRANTVKRVERPTYGILRLVLNTGRILDYNPEHGVVRTP